MFRSPTCIRLENNMNLMRHVTMLTVLAAASLPIFAADRVVYEGDNGPGKGKHIVFIASDHEYRGEETLSGDRAPSSRNDSASSAPCFSARRRKA